jgi:hypothetical protein
LLPRDVRDLILERPIAEDGIRVPSKANWVPLQSLLRPKPLCFPYDTAREYLFEVHCRRKCNTLPGELRTIDAITCVQQDDVIFRRVHSSPRNPMYHEPS